MITRKTLTVLALAAAVAAPTVALADPIPGEVHVKLVGSDYAKPYVDGDEHEDHEFLNNGRTLVIRIPDIESPVTFELRPSNSDLAPTTVTTDKKQFKRQRMGRRLVKMVMKTSVTFKKAEKKAPEKAPDKDKDDGDK